ncbi:DNA ligase [Desulfocicer niacini]
MCIFKILKKRSFHRLFRACLILSLFFYSSLFAGEPALQKPQVYSHEEDIAGWVMSEKLDGIRGYWDGTRMYTRKGIPLNPPAWFTQNFPPFPLDGELWSKRGDFEFIQSVVMDQTPGKGWKHITYNIFEVPMGKGDFLSRLNRARTWFKAHKNTHARFIPQIRIKEKSNMEDFLKEVESMGGEGVIVKNPDIPYHTGRSPHMLKVKNCQDMEGIVVGINKGQGKYENVMGSLTVKLKNGITFKLGTGFSDEIRQKPPQPGSTVTFKYHGFTKNGIPKFASFLRMRQD